MHHTVHHTYIHSHTTMFIAVIIDLIHIYQSDSVIVKSELACVFRA